MSAHVLAILIAENKMISKHENAIKTKNQWWEEAEKMWPMRKFMAEAAGYFCHNTPDDDDIMQLVEIMIRSDERSKSRQPSRAAPVE
jgi:hypothetical protein